LHWKQLLSIGICYPLVIYFYFWNITLSGYAIAAFLLRLSGPFLLLLLFITKEDEKKISKTILFSYFLALSGVIIIMEVWNGFIFLYTVIIGLISAFTFALHTFFKKKVYHKRKKYEFDEIIQGNVDLFLASWNCLTLIIFFFPFGVLDIFKLSLVDVSICLLLGLFPTALSFTLNNIGIKNDTDGNIFILSYIEPIVATINNAIFNQKLSIFTIIGGIIIIISNIIILKFS